MYREQCCGYLIDVTAVKLQENLWQPRLTMTRLLHDGTAGKSQSFPGLTPEFNTAKAATRFAAHLGRQLADEHSSRLKI